MVTISINSDEWAGRFNVRAEISYRDRRGNSSIIQVIHFQPEMKEEETAELLKPLGFMPEDENYSHLVSQVKDTFSEGQALKLVEFLNKRRGTRAYAKPAKKPLPSLVGASSIPSMPSMRDRNVYKVYLEPGYDLDFKVESVNMKVYITLAHLYKEMQGKV